MEGVEGYKDGKKGVEGYKEWKERREKI